MVQWTASPVSGRGRGRSLQRPTLNLPCEEVPAKLPEGIYACRVLLTFEDGTTQGPLPAAIHYGPRPVFQDTKSCEVHLIDATPAREPERVTVEVVARLRDVQDFTSADALREQMAKDVDEARTIIQSMNL